MYLNTLSIFNYKSCQGISIDFFKDDPTTIIGINDSGKSAIIKSIGLLLDPKTPFNISGDTRATSDISNTLLGSEQCAEIFKKLNILPFSDQINGSAILGEFIIEDEEYTDEFKESLSEQLRWSLESFANKKIYLLKAYEPGDSTGKYFLYTNDAEKPLGLWNKKATELTQARKELGVTDEDIRNDNSKGRFGNLEIIRGIYSKTTLKPVWSEYPSFIKADLPKFPVYRYIDWNTSLADIENLANDVMKKHIEDSKKALADQAADVSKNATEEVNKEFESLTKELTRDLNNISAIKAKVTFTVAEKVSDIIINKTTSDGDIRLDSQGEGVKRQILFAFLKWANTRNSEETETSHKQFIWCFDEPESHLYPTAQRDLFAILAGLSQGNYQIILGTHSTIFIDRLRLNEIYKIKLKEKYSEILKCTTIDDVHDVLGVRNSDILFYDLFLAVEGETDIVLLPHFYKLHSGKSLEENAIKLIPLNGSGNYKHNKQILENILGDFKKVESTVHYVFDSDTGETGANVYLLGTCDIEDLFPNEVWIRLVQEKCGIGVTDDELNGLRGQLDPKIENRKFHKLLAALVANKSGQTVYLPSKRICAQIIQKYIITIEQVPNAIINVLEKIKNVQKLDPPVIEAENSTVVEVSDLHESDTTSR
ncbi:MAG TPA: AAA family ATPase [Chitinophagales bacterium]|nr:AAA family ATPase [Chitinophagales bacterium]HRG27810.1 AAA family ATPase [Chitinophagales bacterium]HRG84521.1 AAA family ATPase [Chitinophagales bacterium]HRH53283.1 AAA family ATPase [Chitinophagales bacterium]